MKVYQIYDLARFIHQTCRPSSPTSAAEQACRKALSINPDDLTSNVSLARILVAQGDKEGAEEASSKARVLGWKDELAQDEHNA